jgi:hypothetical protein
LTQAPESTAWLSWRRWAVDPGVAHVFDRLRHVLKRAGRAPRSLSDHATARPDMFVVPRLLRLSPARGPGGASLVSVPPIGHGRVYVDRPCPDIIHIGARTRLREQLKMNVSEYRRSWGCPLDSRCGNGVIGWYGATRSIHCSEVRGGGLARAEEGHRRDGGCQGVLWPRRCPARAFEAQEPSIVPASRSTRSDFLLVQ